MAGQASLHFHFERDYATQNKTVSSLGCMTDAEKCNIAWRCEKIYCDKL